MIPLSKKRVRVDIPVPITFINKNITQNGKEIFNNSNINKTTNVNNTTNNNNLTFNKIDSVNTVTINTTNISSAQQSESNQLYPLYINTEYYNLFVVDQNKFTIGMTPFSTNIPERFTASDIAKDYSELDPVKKRKIKTFPSLFIPKPLQDNASPSCDQYGYIGFIDNIETRLTTGVITWHTLAQISLKHIRSFIEDFGFLGSSEFNTPHWAIKQIDLLHIFTNKMKATLPTIPNKDVLLPVLHIKGNQQNPSKDISLEFTNYYYSRNGKANFTKITKTLHISGSTSTKWRKNKLSTFVFNEHDVKSRSDFSSTLPGVSLLTNFLPKIPLQHLPHIIPKHVILGKALDWQYYKLIENGNQLMVFPSDFQSEAANPSQAIGELIEAIIDWVVANEHANNPDMKELLAYLESFK